MPDVYANIAEADPAMQERLAGVLELRAADRQQREMLESYTADLALNPGARVLEVGCGTGAVSRFLATLENVGEVVGVDPGALFIDRARELTQDYRISFVVGDGTALEFEDGVFDAVVCHTTLCHVPDCSGVLAEAHRVLRSGGELAVFDGDYATTTVAIRSNDPLQACVDHAIATLVHDPWLVRRLVGLIRGAGFQDCRLRSFAYTQTNDADYMLTLVDRGADVLLSEGKLSTARAEQLKEEARARVAAGTFFGHIAYASVIARRP
jgi:ubiquinone/menaquinone biosynthesis C-methylase UbiE